MRINVRVDLRRSVVARRGKELSLATFNDQGVSDKLVDRVAPLWSALRFFEPS